MLTLTNLQKSFGANRAVDGLSLEVRKGEILGLLGPNGAGKTTTIRMATGLLAPDAGKVDLDGAGSPINPQVRLRMGLAPQSLAIYEELTADENLQFFGTIQGLGGTALQERVDWALNFVGLVDRRKSLAKTFSGGMMRRLNIASAVVHDPQIVFLDEPTVGVDPQSRNAILERIIELRKLGRTIIYSTHYMEEAERLCDRVAIMDHGRLLALDTVDALKKNHASEPELVAQTSRGELRIKTGDPVAELSKLQSQGGLHSFKLEQPTLEAVFLHLTGRSLRDE